MADETNEFADELVMRLESVVRDALASRAVQLSQWRTKTVSLADDLRAENIRLRNELSEISKSRPSSSAPSLLIEISKSRSSNQAPSLRAVSDSISGEISPKPISADFQLGLCATADSGLLRESGALSADTLQRTITEQGDIWVARRKFRELAASGAEVLSASDIVSAMQLCSFDFGGDGADSLEILCSDIKQSFRALNEAFPQHCHGEQDELTLECFHKVIAMGSSQIDELFAEEVAKTLHELREFCVKHTTLDMIVQEARLTHNDMQRTLGVKRDRLRWLEPVTAVMIILNAITIGLQEDVLEGHLVWQIFEIVFTTFFVVEMLLKIRHNSLAIHFLGADWVWNWFDFAIVVLAVFDMFATILSVFNLAKTVNLNRITILRMARLLRIARIVRLLRLQFFKELTIMVNGVIGGLRTLFWAFVLLLVLAYVVGVMMRQITRDSYSCDAGDGGNTFAERHLCKFRSVLFRSVPMSMLTVFRCYTDGCASPDGTPLISHLLEAHGPLFAMGYLFLTVFIFFGVFNLIMAVFVENTLEYARIDQQKRQQLRNDEHIRVAQELRKLVLKLCSHKEVKTAQGSTPGTPTTSYTLDEEPPAQGLLKYLKKRTDRPCDARPHDKRSDSQEYLNMNVSRHVFEEVLDDPKVKDLLEDLEISVSNHSKLFDIIDSNGSGSLDVGELVEGLMKLRGPADKGDVVCAGLMVRSTQRHLKRLESDLLKRHVTYESAQEDMKKSLDHIQMQIRRNETRSSRI